MYGIPRLVKQWNLKRKLQLLYSRNVWFLHEISSKDFLKKIEFSNNFLHYLKFSALSVRQSDAYNMKWKTGQTTCTVDGIDASFASERTFLMDFLSEVVKK